VIIGYPEDLISAPLSLFEQPTLNPSFKKGGKDDLTNSSSLFKGGGWEVGCTDNARENKKKIGCSNC